MSRYYRSVRESVGKPPGILEKEGIATPVAIDLILYDSVTFEQKTITDFDEIPATFPEGKVAWI
jgi:hypothetical protein